MPIDQVVKKGAAIKNVLKETEEDDAPTKAAILRKAIMVAVLMFFFSVGIFIGAIILIAKFANKAPGGS